MSYQLEKEEVVNFFENHVLKYIIPDLENLMKIKANEDGSGACAVPQAMTTFSVCDLFGYLLDKQEAGALNPRIKYFLKIKSLFGNLIQGAISKDLDIILNVLSDDVRSSIAHRFFLIKFDITKDNTNALISNNADRLVFHTNFFYKEGYECNKINPSANC